MDVRVGLWRRLRAKELMLLNCGVGEDSWESLGLQGDPTSPFTSWQIDGETMETVTDFIFLGSKIIADGDCSHKIKRCLLLRRKAKTNLDSILKSRDITLPTKVCIVKTMFFLVAMYGCKSWTIKKVESQRIDAFELWCWRRFLRVPWTAMRSNYSILNDICPEYSLEGLMLKLKLQYPGHVIQIANSLEKALMLGKMEGRRRRGRQMTGRLDGITDSVDVSQQNWTWNNRLVPNRKRSTSRLYIVTLLI